MKPILTTTLLLISSCQLLHASTIIQRFDDAIHTHTDNGINVANTMVAMNFGVISDTVYTGAGVYLTGIENWDETIEYYFFGPQGPPVASGLGVNANLSDTGLNTVGGLSIYLLDFEFQSTYLPNPEEFYSSESRPQVDLFFGIHLYDGYPSLPDNRIRLRWVGNGDEEESLAWNSTDPSYYDGISTGGSGSDPAFYLRGFTVPEPSSASFLVLGSVLLLRRKRN